MQNKRRTNIFEFKIHFADCLYATNFTKYIINKR